MGPGAWEAAEDTPGHRAFQIPGFQGSRAWLPNLLRAAPRGTMQAPCSPFPLYFLKTSTCANPTCSEAHLARLGGARGSASGFRGSDSAATVLCGAWSPGPRFPPLRDPAWTSAPWLRGQPTARLRSGRARGFSVCGGEGYPVNICLSFYELHECSLYEVLPLLPTFSLHYVFIAIINYL